MKRVERKKRVTPPAIAEGCYPDAYGITVLARIGSKKAGTYRETRDRFDLTDANGRPYSRTNNFDLVTRRAQLLEDLRNNRIPGADGAPGSLAFAIDEFLRLHPVVKGADSRKNEDYRYLLAVWRKLPIAQFQVKVLLRSKSLIAAELAAMTAAGAAPSTVNSRKRALGDVLRVELEKELEKRRAKGQTADDDATVPTDLIPGVPAKALEARGVDLQIMIGILDKKNWPDRGRATRGGKRPPHSEIKTRLRVMLWSGLPHASLVRLPRTSVKFAKARVLYPARKKGRGSPAVWVDALPQLLDALRDYDAARLWQKKFSRSSMHKAFVAAVARRRATLQAAAESPNATEIDKTLYEQFITEVPENCRPYDFRHSFLTEIARQFGKDAAQAIGQHLDPKTTERYTKAAVPDVIKSAIGKMRAVWAPGATPPASSDALHLVKGEFSQGG